MHAFAARNTCLSRRATLGAPPATQKIALPTTTSHKRAARTPHAPSIAFNQKHEEECHTLNHMALSMRSSSSAAAPRTARLQAPRKLSALASPAPRKAVGVVRALEIDFSDPDTLVALSGLVLGVVAGIGAPIWYINRTERDEERLEELRALNRATYQETGEYMKDVSIGWCWWRVRVETCSSVSRLCGARASALGRWLEFSRALSAPTTGGNRASAQAQVDRPQVCSCGRSCVLARARRRRRDSAPTLRAENRNTSTRHSHRLQSHTPKHTHNTQKQQGVGRRRLIASSTSPPSPPPAPVRVFFCIESGGRAPVLCAVRESASSFSQLQIFVFLCRYPSRVKECFLLFCAPRGERASAAALCRAIARSLARRALNSDEVGDLQSGMAAVC